MENKDSNIKSQETGGLKLMTVFIAVLALHVVVIGGFTVYHLMSGGGTDTDLAGTDKTQKSPTTSVTDGSLPTASQGDKSALATSPAPDNTTTTATTTPAPDVATPAATPTPSPAPAAVPPSVPAPALTLIAPKPAPLAPPAEGTDQSALASTGPISSELAPPPDSAPPSLAAAPIAPAPLAAGPVHMPPTTDSAPIHTHEQIYTVKITDSYKKIALAHHVTVAQLKEANHIHNNVLHTGQKLIIPSNKTLVTENATTPAPVLDSTTTEPLASEPASGPTDLAAAPSTVATTTTHGHVYTVVKGDTLTKIAHKFKTTTSALMSANDITDPARLSIGKKLKIPSQESRSARNNPPASTQPGQVQAKGNAPSAQLANFVP